MRDRPNLQLHIIDTLGPFFVNMPETDVINWSKVPFSRIESNGRLSQQTQRRIIDNFTTYLKKVSALGYDTISIDDLAHMVDMPFYSAATKRLIKDYCGLYTQVFAIAKRYGMRIYVNTDYLFVNDEIATYLHSGASPENLFTDMLERAFKTLPSIDGIILRVGENDGKDVSGTFLSRLFMRTPKHANNMLKTILPLFEKYQKQLIFRTWTVGAYEIGDLIWNKKTYDTVFASIDSDALIISMKFGDTDFMRYLELNPLFFHGTHKKIIELQTRREWEGMGTLPSFVGWDYDDYLQKLHRNESVIGIHVWCQTGGWAKAGWNNLTYLQESSLWNELNTEVTIALAKGSTVEEAVRRFCESRFITDTERFVQLLRQSEITIKKGLYIADLAKQTLYFRRTRIPPLLWLTWDMFHLPAAVTHLHRLLMPRQNTVVQDGEDAVAASNAMIQLATTMNLESTCSESLLFARDTFVITASLRRYLVGDATINDITAFNESIKAYTQKYPQHYSFTAIKPIGRRHVSRKLLSPILRKTATYRKRDTMLLRTSRLQAKIIRLYLKKSHSHLANQSMGLETLFK